MRTLAPVLVFVLMAGALAALPGRPHHRPIGAYHALLNDYHAFQQQRIAGQRSPHSWKPGAYLTFRDTTSSLSKSQAYAYWTEVVDTDIGALAWEWRNALTSELQYTFNLDAVTFGDAEHSSSNLILTKQLMPRLILSYRHDFDTGRANAFENDRISLEYMLTRHLSVLIEQGGVANTGAMLLVRWRK